MGAVAELDAVADVEAVGSITTAEVVVAADLMEDVASVEATAVELLDASNSENLDCSVFDYEMDAVI